ncbi:glucosamine-6-phosphate deaminase, partial [Candidatus Bathyarchaeota archaeon]|nr:glucosamine-6-phosphate deaminase [Candidatus Bathyarchaeota archaeon]
MKITISKDYEQMGKKVAKIIADNIKQNSVLGLPTGSTPIGMYKELVRMHREEGLDFSEVVTFNLDEYYPMTKENPQSYYSFMNYWFFDHVNIDRRNTHIPNGELEKNEINQFCRNYEKQIKKNGGIDLQVIGIGGGYYNASRQFIGGHIGFNEPSSDFDSRTRLVRLSEQTRSDNSRFFKHLEDVPHYAITMGLATIMEAKKIILLAHGDHKSIATEEALEGQITPLVPASILQKHPRLTAIIDKGAASRLSFVVTPWLHHGLDWAKEASKAKSSISNLLNNAVTWLSIKLNKPIRELTLEDYQNNALSALIKNYDNNPNKLNKEVMQRLKSKVMFKGKILSDKKIVIISPHPDDDVISIGGTIKLLKDSGNEIATIYMVSGNIAVRDRDVLEYLRQKNDRDKTDRLKNLIISKKIPFKKLLKLKTQVREAEAIEACKILGLPEDSQIFLRLPFFETGMIWKSPVTDRDIVPLKKTLEKESPDIIIVHGEIADPHGTHGKCMDIFSKALKRCKFDKS